MQEVRDAMQQPVDYTEAHGLDTPGGERALGRGYLWIKTLKKELRRPVYDLLVLAPANDPFYAGSELDHAKAAWFKTIWTRLGFTNGVHLRRIHYRLLDWEARQKHDGMPYENTERDWDYLTECSKLARLLEYVSADAFVDRRNPAAHLPDWTQRAIERAPHPDILFPDGFARDRWAIPGIQSNLRVNLRRFVIPSPTVEGYEASDWADRAYYLEVWVEKSTQDDILVPLCQDLGIGLVTSVGFQSMTRAIELLKRVKRLGKPTRILYISDFDPAGDGMPVAVARHLEFYVPLYAPGADVKLVPLALTREQVEAYRLPRIPVKETDRRKTHFEERYGEGAVELDALEARVPGTLEALVRAAVAPFDDATLADRLGEAEDHARAIVRQAWHATIAGYQGELGSIQIAAAGILQQYEGRLEALDNELQAQLAPLKDRLQAIQQAIDAAIQEFDPGLPARPTPEVDPPHHDAWLFDSQRDYVTQLNYYKARQVGGAGA
jgi:hypothetical protein